MPREDKNKTIAIVTYPRVALLDLVVTQTVLDRGASYRTVSVGERTEPMDSNTSMVVIPEKRFEDVPDPFPGTDPCLLPDAPSYEGALPHYWCTWKLSIIPPSRCSAMWQCAIQLPGLLVSTRRSTVSPVRMSTVSFHTRFSFGTPSRLMTRKRWPWMWKGCCMGWSE